MAAAAVVVVVVIWRIYEQVIVCGLDDRTTLITILGLLFACSDCDSMTEAG
jgi:hypothetical protein